MDMLGFTDEFLSKFKVMTVCSSCRSHSMMGKSGLVFASPATKWFLKV